MMLKMKTMMMMMIFTMTILITILLADELEKMRPAYHCDFRKTFNPQLEKKVKLIFPFSHSKNEMVALTFWRKFEQSLI